MTPVTPAVELARVIRRALALSAGGIRAQDERERLAGARCGVPRERHGEAWPDAVADRIEQLETALRMIAAMRFEGSHLEACACGPCIAWRTLNEAPPAAKPE